MKGLARIKALRSSWWYSCLFKLPDWTEAAGKPQSASTFKSWRLALSKSKQASSSESHDNHCQHWPSTADEVLVDLRFNTVHTYILQEYGDSF